MNSRNISEALVYLDDKYIEEAVCYRRKNNILTLKRCGAAAACVAVVLIGVFTLSGLHFDADAVTLSNGKEIVFYRAETGSGQQNIDIGFKIHSVPLTDVEEKMIFPGLDVNANKIIAENDNSLNNNTAEDELIGVEGKIGNIKIVISVSEDKSLLDTVVEGTEKKSAIGETTVRAGYYLSEKNSHKERNVIYYAYFKISDSMCYVENAGSEAQSENIKNELADVIEKLIYDCNLDYLPQ